MQDGFCAHLGVRFERHDVFSPFLPLYSTLNPSVAALPRSTGWTRPLPPDPLYNDAEKSPKLGRHSPTERPAVTRGEKKARSPKSERERV